MRISDWSSDVCSSDLLGSLKAIAFDKTGTLTEGRPRITDVVPVDGADEGELLALAVAVEALSDHPLAQAIVKDGRERLNDRAVPTAGDLKRSEEHTSELQSLMRTSYAVFCLKKKIYISRRSIQRHNMHINRSSRM